MNFLAALLVFVVSACSGNPVIVRPQSFERPGKVVFVCVDANSEPVANVKCDEDGGEYDENAELHALVTQTSRGEVAAVNLADERVIDTNKTIPGYTFTRVGELPTDLLIREGTPDTTYVANFGSKTVMAAPTRYYVTGILPEGRVMQESEPLPAGPNALATAGSFLFATLPESGSVAQVPILEDGSMGQPMSIALQTGTLELPPIATEAAIPAIKVCPDSSQLATPNTSLRTLVTSNGAAPQPWAIAVDRVTNPVAPRLLVSDAALPVIHVLEVSDGTVTELPPILTGSPTRALVLTPESASGRFIYAVDGNDGSILVIDYASREIVPVGLEPWDRADRLVFDSPARALAVIQAEGEVCPTDEIGPGWLRGIFVAVTLSDGTLRIIDLEDLDRGCRGGNEECENPVLGTDQFVYIRRHRPRIGALLQDPIALTTAPSFVTDTGSYLVSISGVTDIESVPDMTLLESCPPGMVQGYPNPDNANSPLFCVLADPWAAKPERWSVSRDGVIPGTSGGRGNLSISPAVLTGEVDFCERGVLGTTNIAEAGLSAEEPEAGYLGDLLAVTSELPDDADERCERLIREDARGNKLPIRFAITRAFRHRLEIASISLENNVDLQTVADCFPGYVNYDVRTHKAFSVVGDRTGFLHRVLADVNDVCRVDVTQSRELQGRARASVFRNSRIAFHIASVPEGALPVMLTFVVGQVPGPLSLKVGLLPSDVQYNPTDNRIYVVDMAVRGLIPIQLNPIEVLTSYE